jgi:cyclic dehypoxanthinyl futalosine synthase
MAESNGRIEAIAEKVEAGERLSFDEGVDLFERATLLELAAMADRIRWRLHPEPVVTYVVGRNINYTNICWVRCAFCAFYRLPGASDGYVLSKEEIFQKIQELIDLGGTEVLMQGGLNPALKIDYYEDLFRAIKERFPVHMHALSAAEIIYIAQISRLSVRQTLKRLQAAGLDSIPGAGAELLVDDIRNRVSPLKDTPEAWLNLMQTAHELGIPSTATMMYGMGETLAQRVEHLLKVRELQDRTGGFTAFIPWGYQPNGDELRGEAGTGYGYLRTVAICRIMLDNIPNIQASWLTMGPKIGQLSLQYGVNDFGSTVLEENVVTTETTRRLMTLEEMRRVIRDAGLTPKRRNTRYQILE